MIIHKTQKMTLHEQDNITTSKYLLSVYISLFVALKTCDVPFPLNTPNSQSMRHEHKYKRHQAFGVYIGFIIVILSERFKLT